VTAHEDGSTTKEDVIRAHLNVETITRVAQWAARMLNADGLAIVDLAPGDMTLYKIHVISPGQPKLTEFGAVAHTNDYSVTLATSFGATYPWRGHRMEAGYVTDKWVNDDRLWTGVVLTEFLNALAEALGDPA
jgi:hypothetical protein